MKTCPNCNSKLQDNEHLCMYCGTKLQSINQNIANKQETTPRDSEIYERLNDFNSQFTSNEYKKIIIQGKKIYIKEIYKSQKAAINQAIMKVEIDGVEKNIYPGIEGDYIILQGKANTFYEGPLVVAVIRKKVRQTTPKQTTQSSTSTSYTPPVNQTSSSDSDLPKYQYWLLISSWLLSFTYVAPIIGILASFIAYSDIEASNHKDKEGQMGLTIGAGVLHGFFILLGIYSNGGF